MLREVSQKRQLPYVITYMWDLKHTTKEKTRNTIINTEKKKSGHYQQEEVWGIHKIGKGD